MFGALWAIWTLSQILNYVIVKWEKKKHIEIYKRIGMAAFH